MRSQGYLSVAVWMGWWWRMGLCLTALVASGLPQAAQATDVVRPIVTEGAQNPFITREISDGIADLSALQIDLTAEDEDVVVETVTIGFGVPFGEITTGNTSFLDELRARLIAETVNVNGVEDAGEPVLGTQTVIDLEDPVTVLYTLTPPLVIPVGTTTTLLVVVDINQPATQSADAHPSHPSIGTRWHNAAAWLFLPFIGAIGYACRSNASSHRIQILALLFFVVSLTLTGCTDDDSEDELRFVVNLSSNGLASQGQRLGPESAISGITIRLQ